MGTGNLANRLVPFLLNKQEEVLQIYGRNKEQLSEFSQNYKLKVCSDLDLIDRNAQAYLLCIKDDSIHEIAKKLSELLSKDKIIIHFSGTQTLEVIPLSFQNRAILWPLQSFNKEVTLDWSAIPIFVTVDEKVKEVIEEWLNLYNLKYFMVTQHQKMLIHLAAVIANNFTNFNLIMAHKILQEVPVSLEILKPIMEQTIHSSLSNNPENLQTGPARRNDQLIVNKQIHLLSEHFPEFEEIYSIYSRHITEFYQSK